MQFKIRRDLNTAREADLEEALKGCRASRRTAVMNLEQLKVKLALEDERKRLLQERSDELSQDRSGFREERRILQTKADMQQQKLLMFEEQLQKMQSEVAETRAQVADTMEQRARISEELRQEREAWRREEVRLKEKVAKTRRELEHFKRRASMDQLRARSRVSAEVTLLRVQIKRLEEDGRVKAQELATEQQKQANMELEKHQQEQREEVLKQEAIRKLLQCKLDLEAVKSSESALQNMLEELQEGLLKQEDAILE